MRVTLTGATGRIGQSLVAALRERGDDVTVLSRDPSARARPSATSRPSQWDPKAGPAPAEALSGRDAVIHLAGEDVGQRWSDDVKREIRESRELGTRNLVAGIARRRAAPARAGLRLGVGLLRPARRRAGRRVRPRRPTTSSARSSQAWEREARAAEDARPARRPAAHRRRARQGGRRAEQDAAAVQGRRRRPGRRRQAVPAVDPPRRRRRALPRRARRQRRAGRARSTPPRRSR